MQITPPWLPKLLPAKLRPRCVQDIYRFPEEVEQKILELIKAFSMTPASLSLLEDRYSDETADFYFESFPASEDSGTPACV